MMEARRIALEILARAEQERQRFAEQEASKGSMQVDSEVELPTPTRESNGAR